MLNRWFDNERIHYFIRASKALTYISICIFLLMRTFNFYTGMIIVAIINSILLCIHFYIRMDVLCALEKSCLDQNKYKIIKRNIESDMKRLECDTNPNSSLTTIIISCIMHLYMIIDNIIYLIQNNTFSNSFHTILFIFHILSLFALGITHCSSIDCEASLIITKGAADLRLKINDPEYYERCYGNEENT